MIPSLGPQTAQGIQAGALSPFGIQSPAAAPTAEFAGALPIPAELAPDLVARFANLEIIAPLGKGGMGAVYKARQTKLDRLVALKVLPAEFNRDPTFAERFLREARALARLNHPGIVAVHDFGEADGQPYFLMEFVEGANLRQVIRAGKLPADQALALVTQVCEALQFAHDEGIIHRDIKPENILLDKRGRVKIADFGLAKLLGADRVDHTLTATHLAMGTMNYMAPEQLDNAARVDHRADIYSLGVVLYEMLTGQVPRGKFDPPSHRAQVDARLDAVVLRALESDPERRYQKVSEMQTAMAAVTQGSPLGPRVEVRPPSAPSIAASYMRTPSFQSALGKIGLNLDIEVIKRHVEAPAIWLMVTGVLTVLISLVGVIDQSIVWSGAHGSSQWTIPVKWFLFLVNAPLGFLIILGSQKMMKLEMFGMARLGCKLALLPLGPAALLGIPIGIWTLMVLSHPKVRSAFRTDFDAPPPRPVPDPVGRMLLGPRRGLLIGGILVLAAGGLLTIMGVGLAWQERHTGLYWSHIVSLECLGIANFFMAIFMIVASRSMATCQHHGLARLGSILALLPLSPFLFLTIPIGLWGLSALKRPRVLDAFGMPVSEAELQTEAEARPSSPSKMTGFALFVGGFTSVCIVIAYVLGLAIYPMAARYWFAEQLSMGAVIGLVLGSLLYGVYSEARKVFRRKPANRDSGERDDRSTDGL
jgi:tRNA A-37 threonylcarbamoyl transferase component Bud32/uncharacterized membrane protein